MGRLAGMTCLVSHTTVDCRNAYELSEWWKALLGYQDVDGDPNEPGHEECMILDPASGHHILFIEVPEAKDGKNRLHFDLVPRSGTRDEETDRVLAAGATIVDDLRGTWGPGHGVGGARRSRGQRVLRAADPGGEGRHHRFVCGLMRLSPLGTADESGWALSEASPRVVSAPPVEPDRGRSCCLTLERPCPSPLSPMPSWPMRPSPRRWPTPRRGWSARST